MNKQIGFLLLIWFLAVPPAHSKDLVIVVKISGSINPAVAEYVSQEISQAYQVRRRAKDLGLSPGGPTSEPPASD